MFYKCGVEGEIVFSNGNIQQTQVKSSSQHASAWQHRTVTSNSRSPTPSERRGGGEAGEQRAAQICVNLWVEVDKVRWILSGVAVAAALSWKRRGLP